MTMPQVENDIYEEAARSGLHTPEALERMRRLGIRPATKPWVPPMPLVKQRPAWLAFLLRTMNRVAGL